MTRRRYALLFLLLLGVEVVIALFVRDAFIRPYLGDLLVTVLLCCLARAVFPGRIPGLPIYVFLFAAAVEVTQAFDFVGLMGWESNRVLSVLLGSTFSFADLVCYGAGCILFALLQRTDG